jgi:signal transduction histidine kinase
MSTKLLLCDAADGLAQLQYALIRSGNDFETEVVTEGFRAVEVAARTQPQIVVTEIGLEGLSGTELLRRLMAMVPETRVVCWTGVPSPFAVAEMLEAGASGYLLKEDGPEAVVRAIRAILDGNVVFSPRVASQIAERLAESIKHQRELEVALADTSERLEAMTSAKADFLANVSHELRTPVTIAKGIAFVLKSPDVSDQEKEEFLAQLDSSLERLMATVDEMVTITELDRGTLLLRVSELDLAPILRHVIEEIGRRYEGVQIDQAIPATLPAMADPAQIAEVVRQILDNACRYSPQGRPVHLRARPMEEGVVVSITDHGEGIDREVLARAFSEPFSTGEEILRKERSGVGVGLNLARQLVLKHGGIMWADPLPAGGTRVSFCLPLHRGERVTKPPLIPVDVPAPPPVIRPGTTAPDTAPAPPPVPESVGGPDEPEDQPTATSS